MKPAARDQDIPRGAGIGAPRRARRREEPTEPGERQGERDSPRSTAATPLLASPVPRPQAPAPTPPVPASLRRLHGRPLQKPAQQTQREAAAGLEPLSAASVPDPRARPPAARLPCFLPSLPPGLAAARSSASAAAAAAPPSAPPPAHPPPPPRARTHVRCSATRDLAPYSTSVVLIGPKRPAFALLSCYGWFPLPYVLTKAACYWVNLEKEAGRDRRRRGFLGA